MFDPVSLAIMGGGMAAKLGGDLISRRDAIENANAIAEARNSVLLKYLSDQKKLEQEGRGYLKTTLDTYAPGNTQLPDAQAARTGVITSTMGGPSDPGDITVSRSAPKNVRGTIAKRMLASFEDATERAKAMGSLGGYGDQWSNNNAGIVDTGRRINTLNNFSRGNSGILSSQQDLAQIGATQQPSIWGPVLSAGGSLLMNVGAGGMGKPAAAPTMPNVGNGIWAGL